MERWTLTLARPRYVFGGHRPSETAVPPRSLGVFHQIPEEVVPRAALPTTLGGVSRSLRAFRLRRSRKAPTYAEQSRQDGHERRAVKVHGVLSSRADFLASSREHQLRRRPGGDSRAMMTPFMQDGNEPPMNFATFGSLELRPPFTSL